MNKKRFKIILLNTASFAIDLTFAVMISLIFILNHGIKNKALLNDHKPVVQLQSKTK